MQRAGRRDPARRARPAVRSDEEACRPGAGGGRGLAEEQRLPEPALGDVRAHGGVGGEARHQDDGDLGTERACETLRLVELHLEEAAPVERLGDRLDAHRRSASPSRPRGRRARSGPRVAPLSPAAAASANPGSPGAGSARQVGIERRLDDPLDDVAAVAQRAVGELAPQPLERLGVEPVRLEDRAGGGIDLVEDHRSSPEWGASRHTERGARPPRSRSR